MRRWFHDRFNRHQWEVVSHLHDVQQGEETFDYHLIECNCGDIREFIAVRHELPFPFPGITAGFFEVTVNDLESLEQAKVWARP